MALSERDASVLQHIVEHCLEVEETLRRFGHDKAAFGRDFLFRNAIAMPVFAATELTKHLSDAFKATHGGIPWRALGAMRNRFAHDYQSVDWEICWATAEQDIPGLKRFCVGILQENGQDVPRATDL